ncbi:MAG: hypothetical protein D6820_11845 [Lentisphaerae bacterium]|nr:MAG: hypothetical protein D6820_11845 [Lentisphaerota bacterium]
MRQNNNSLMPLNVKKGRNKLRGQALVEFTVALIMILGICLVCVLFLAIFTEWGWRVLRLVGLEYP